MSLTMGVKLSEEARKLLEEQANKEFRSMSNMIEVMIYNYIKKDGKKIFPVRMLKNK
jgi:hypothetical protein